MIERLLDWIAESLTRTIIALIINYMVCLGVSLTFAYWVLH